MSSHPQELFFSIDITESDFLAYYTGKVKNIIVRSEDNRTIQFPANLLQQFVSHIGVKGRFKICYSKDNKLLSINRVD